MTKDIPTPTELEDYQVERRDRDNRDGGVFVAVKHELQATRETEMETDECMPRKTTKNPTTTALIERDPVHTLNKMTSQEEPANESVKDDVSTQSFGSRMSACVDAVKAEIFIVVTLVACAVGVGLGLLLSGMDPSEDALTWIGLPGEIFLRCLSASIVPLIICMIITSTATLDPRKNGKIAVVGFIVMVLSHFVAAIIAICMFSMFKSEDQVDAPDHGNPGEFTTDIKTQDVFADLIRNIFPDNVVAATYTQTTTEYVQDTIVNESASHNYTAPSSTETRKVLVNASGTNILGLITICAAVGMASNKVLSPGCEFLRFFEQAQKVIFVIIRWIFWMTPVGVASLIAVSLARVDDVSDVFVRLGRLIGAVCLGLTVHLLLAWAAVVFLFTRKNPFVALSHCTRPFIVAFSATATSVALPDMMKSCHQCGVSRPVSSFLLPMSVNLQADGSSMFIASSALFLAQSGGGGSVEDIVVIGAMTTVLSCSIPPVPSSSIVTLAIILRSLNLPLNEVALLFAAEWLLDRYRSGVNAVSHVLTCLVTDTLAPPIDDTDEGVESRRQTGQTSIEDDLMSLASQW